MTQLSQIREKLDLIGEKYLLKETLDKLIEKFAPSYTISTLCDNGVISPLKRGKRYINNINRDIEDPFRTIDLYFELDELYMFGGLGVYQMYGYSTQLIEKYTVYNNQFAGERTIGKNKYIFRKERDNFFYGVTIAQSGNINYRVMSRERAVIQMIKEGKIFNILPKFINKEELIKMAEKNSTKPVVKIIKELCL